VFYNGSELKHNAYNVNIKTYLPSRKMGYKTGEEIKFMAKTEIPKTTEVDSALLESIVESIKSIQYGTITITVHDGKVTQLETSRKQRF